MSPVSLACLPAQGQHHFSTNSRGTSPGLYPSEVVMSASGEDPVEEEPVKEEEEGLDEDDDEDDEDDDDEDEGDDTVERTLKATGACGSVLSGGHVSELVCRTSGASTTTATSSPLRTNAAFKTVRDFTHGDFDGYGEDDEDVDRPLPPKKSKSKSKKSKKESKRTNGGGRNDKACYNSNLRARCIAKPLTKTEVRVMYDVTRKSDQKTERRQKSFSTKKFGESGAWYHAYLLFAYIALNASLPPADAILEDNPEIVEAAEKFKKVGVPENKGKSRGRCLMNLPATGPWQAAGSGPCAGLRSASTSSEASVSSGAFGESESESQTGSAADEENGVAKKAAGCVALRTRPPTKTGGVKRGRPKTAAEDSAGIDTTGTTKAKRRKAAAAGEADDECVEGVDDGDAPMVTEQTTRWKFLWSAEEKNVVLVEKIFGFLSSTTDAAVLEATCKQAREFFCYDSRSSVWRTAQRLLAPELGDFATQPPALESLEATGKPIHLKGYQEDVTLEALRRFEAEQEGNENGAPPRVCENSLGNLAPVCHKMKLVAREGALHALWGKERLTHCRGEYHEEIDKLEAAISSQQSTDTRIRGRGATAGGLANPHARSSAGTVKAEESSSFLDMEVAGRKIPSAIPPGKKSEEAVKKLRELNRNLAWHNKRLAETRSALRAVVRDVEFRLDQVDFRLQRLRESDAGQLELMSESRLEEAQEIRKDQQEALALKGLLVHARQFGKSLLRQPWAALQEFVF